MDANPFTLEITQDAPDVLHPPRRCGSLDLRLADCMDVMKGFADGYFDLAIVDPPYGIGAAKMNLGYSGGSKLAKKEWDDEPPPPEYFAELRRVSKHQIIWGANYFASIWPMKSWIVWDKGASFKDRSFAEGELAGTSHDKNARVYSYNPLAGGDYIGRIHKTQKPVPLYDWIFANYAAPGMRVLDTHMGSGSIAVAAHYFGAHLTACEIDPDYYKAAISRIARETSQTELL